MSANQNLVYLFPVFSLAYCYLLWLVIGKDTAGRGVIMPEYEPPLDLSPAEVGLLQDLKIGDREITATLVDLAIRGYICIRRVPKTHSYDYQFELLNEHVLKLLEHERDLLNGLFGVVDVKFNAQSQANITNPEAHDKATYQYPASKASFVGRKVNLPDVIHYFYQYVDKAKEILYAKLNAEGYFKSGIYLSGFSFIVIGLCGLVAGWLSHNHIALMANLIVSGLIFIMFGRIMGARSKLGTRAKESIDGFLMFLKSTESLRFKMTQSPNSTEYDGTKADLYERYLPYAIALGLEKDWSKQFEGVYAQPVSWLGSKPIEEVFDLSTSINTSKK